MVTEFPDDETAAAAVLTLASHGNVRAKTLRAFTDGETAPVIAPTRLNAGLSVNS